MHTTLRFGGHAHQHIPIFMISHSKGHLYGYGICYGIQQKLALCTRLTSNGKRNCTCFYLYLCLQRAVHFPPFSPCIIYGTSSFKTVVGRLFEGRRSVVIIRTLVVVRNIFSDQCFELLCFVLHDFADLRHGWIARAFPDPRHGWITRAFPPTRKTG